MAVPAWFRSVSASPMCQVQRQCRQNTHFGRTRGGCVNPPQTDKLMCAAHTHTHTHTEIDTHHFLPEKAFPTDHSWAGWVTVVRTPLAERERECVRVMSGGGEREREWQSMFKYLIGTVLVSLFLVWLFKTCNLSLFFCWLKNDWKPLRWAPCELSRWHVFLSQETQLFIWGQ